MNADTKFYTKFFTMQNQSVKFTILQNLKTHNYLDRYRRHTCQFNTPSEGLLIINPFLLIFLIINYFGCITVISHQKSFC